MRAALIDCPKIRLTRLYSLLRLTGDLSDGVLGYDLEPTPVRDELFEFYDRMDLGWEAVLLGREWPVDSSSSDLLPQRASGTARARLLSIAQRFKAGLQVSLQSGPSVGASDSERQGSVLRAELDAGRVFQRTLRLLSDIQPAPQLVRYRQLCRFLADARSCSLIRDITTRDHIISSSPPRSTISPCKTSRRLRKTCAFSMLTLDRTL